MSKTVLMVGTRKGCFLLESDEARRDWTLRGLFCEGWPIYHVIRDADSGSVFAAAASEWHGSSVWRSPTSARRGSSRARACPTRTAT